MCVGVRVRAYKKIFNSFDVLRACLAVGYNRSVEDIKFYMVKKKDVGIYL